MIERLGCAHVHVLCEENIFSAGGPAVILFMQKVGDIF